MWWPAALVLLVWLCTVKLDACCYASRVSMPGAGVSHGVLIIRVTRHAALVSGMAKTCRLHPT